MENKYISKRSDWDGLIIGNHLGAIYTRSRFGPELPALKDMMKTIQPCPICSGTNIETTNTSHSGHGDTGFANLRVTCNDCSCSMGNASGYGDPTYGKYREVIDIWNNVKR